MKRMWENNKMAFLVSAFVLGFMIFGGWAYSTMVTVKINGDHYKQIVQGKDLIADILPPPEYIIESYLVTQQMLDETDRNKLSQYVERGKQLRKDFEDRHEYWNKELPDGAIKTKLVDAAFKPAIAFYEARDNQFIPALQAGDVKKAQEILRDTMTPNYEKHHVAIEEIVPLAMQRNKDDEATAAALITSRSWQLLGLGLLITIGVSILCWNALSSDKRRVKKVAERVDQLRGLCITNLGKATEALKNGDLKYNIVTGTPFFENSAQDEIGQLETNINGIIRQTQGTVAAFEESRRTVLRLIDETGRLAVAVRDGDLQSRGEAQAFAGNYRELLENVNQLVQGVATPLSEVNAIMEKVARQDLTVRVKGLYKGEYDQVKSALNQACEALEQTLSQVSSAAEQVNSAANEINSGSQSLAQGASEQASSLEEVSSSLQEMSSMIKQNAANAKEARSLTEAARLSADKGVMSMQQLSEAVNRIKQSSDATAKIVKTIDEIAFQTNLLALNAAVEAARAGDAGKGFAVVAEEVRNLAMRSAEAAKNTAELIEQSVKNAEGGVAINTEVLTNLEEINKQVNQVTEVMAEIAAASDQQAQGVEQINAAIGQMNQVTQQTAANSEESAAAAEQLSGQSEELLSLVATFQISHSGRRQRPAKAVAPSMPKPVAPMPRAKAKTASAGAAPKGDSFGGGEDLIPFDDMDSSAALQSF